VKSAVMASAVLLIPDLKGTLVLPWILSASIGCEKSLY